MPNTREKLIELLSQVQYLGGLEKKMADHLIANGVTVQKWIPVTERLPEKFNPVLVYDLEKGRDVLWYDDEGFNVIDEYGFAYPVKTVTHWMPLPKPPKGEWL